MAVPRRAWLDGRLVLARRGEHPLVRRVESLSPRNHVHHFRLRAPADLTPDFYVLLRARRTPWASRSTWRADPSLVGWARGANVSAPRRPGLRPFSVMMKNRSMRASPVRWLMLLALALALPRAARAQEGRYTLRPGDTVRVAAPTLHDGVIEGELLKYEGDSLGIREASTGTAYQFPISTIRRLEKNQGRNRGRSVRRWAAAGLFLGAAAGLVAGPLIATADEEGGMVGPTVLAGLGGGVVGLALGAAGGSVFARDHWQRFRTPIPPPAPPAASIGISVPVP